MTNYLGHIEKINPKVNAIVALQDRAGPIFPDRAGLMRQGCPARERRRAR
jgi:hypothetical protein